MKYSNTAITQLTRWYKQILVKCAILNAAILMGSAFVAAPAMAYDIEQDTNLNDKYPSGVITDGITSDGAYTTTFTTDIINVNNTVGGTRALNAFEGSNMTFGGDNTTAVTFTGGERGLNVWDTNTKVDISASDSVNVSGTKVGAFVRDGSALDVSSKSISISSTDEGGLGLYMNAGDVDLTATDSLSVLGDQGIGAEGTSDLDMSAKDITITGGTYAAVYTADSAAADINATGKLGIQGDNWGVSANGTSVVNMSGSDIDISGDKNAVSASGATVNIAKTTGAAGDTIDIKGAQVAAEGNDSWAAVGAYSGGTVNIGNGSQDITISGEEDISVWALANGSQVNINGADVDISSVNGSGVWAQNNTTTSTSPVATVNITGDTVRIFAPNDNGIAAMSQGIVNIEGDTTITGQNAILTRGNAQTHINTSGDHMTVLNGDIDFDYNEATSKTGIDAIVDVTLNGSTSFWNGNTVISYDTKPGVDKLQVQNATVNLKNGATWNAGQITDSTGDTNGRYYTALNNLNVDSANVNIADFTRGIEVENLVAKDANIAGGVMHVTNTINTIDDVIDDYSSSIKLGEGVEISGDIDFAAGTADMYGADTGTTAVTYALANALGSDIQYGDAKTIKVVDGDVTVNKSGTFGWFNGDKGLTLASSGSANGSVVVTGQAGGIEAAADASDDNTHIEYEMTSNDSVDTAKEIKGEFELTGQGTSADKPALTLNANLTAATGADVSITEAKLDGDATYQNMAGATTTVTNSNIGVDVDNKGVWFSDPTSYSGAYNNDYGAFASFENDTFESTASLNNSGDVMLDGVTFDAGAVITGDGDIVLDNGTTTFNNTANTNDVYLTKGTKFAGTLVGGSLDTTNSYIDTGLGSVQNADLYVDAKLGTTNTIDSFAGASGSTVKEINVLGLNYGNADSVDLTIGAGAALDENFAIYGANYYTDYEYNGTTGTLTLKDKLINTSTLRGTGDGSSTFTGNVVVGDKAATTTVGTTNAKVALNNSAQTATITAANGTKVTDGTNTATLKGTAAGLNVAEGITVGTAGTYGINSTGVAKLNGLTVGTTSYGIDNAGAASVASLSLGGTAVTATAAEINALSGVTSNVQDQLDDKQDALTAGNGINIDTSTDTISAVAGDGTITVDPAGIKVGTIQTANIANSAVTSAKIASGAVTEAKIGSGAVTSAKIANGAVTTTKLSTGALNNMLHKATTSKGLTITAGDSSTPADIALNLASTGGLEEDATNGLQIKAGGVSLSMIDPAAITSAAVAAGSTDTELVNATSLGATRGAMETKLAAGATGYDVDAKTLKVQGNDVLSTANVGPAYTGSSLADVNTYVSTNAAKFANVGTTAALITDVMADKEAWIGEELGYDPTTTDANTVLSGEGFTDQDGDGKVSFNDALVDLSDGIDDVLDGSTPFTGFTMTNNASTPANVTMLAIDDGTFADTAATTFATNATVNKAKTDVENKLSAGATGYDINAKTLKVQGNTVLSTADVGPAYTYTPGTSTIADVTTYVTTNGAKFANVASTAGMIETVMADKEAWIGEELGYDPTTTDANTVLSAAGFTDMDGDTKVSFKDAVVELHTDLGDVADFTGSTTGNISNSAPGVNPNATTAAGAIANIDATMGQIHGLASTLTAAQGAGNLQPGSTVSGHLTALAGAIGDRSAYGTANYITASETVASSLLALDGALGDLQDEVGLPQTAASGTGQFATRKIGDDINLVDAVDELGQNMVSLTADNIFTGENTFKNSNGIHLQNNVGGNDTNLQATANGLTVDRNVEATGFKISTGTPVVTSIDVDGSGVTSASAAESIMATAATVYNGAENGLYDGTKVAGDTTSTTIKQALTATNSALNNVLIADGSMVDAAKVNVLWNGANTALSGALGNGIYTGATHVSAGDDLTTAIKNVDVALGADLTSVQTRTTGVLLTTNSANENISALDTAIGGDVTSTNYVAAANSVNANISALDTQVKQNADDISDINTAITVTADGNYILAANDVKANLGALDTQVKQNADDISTINTTIGTYGTIVTKDAAPAFTGSTLADVNTYVATNGAAVADVATTAGVINVVMADKEAWIGRELGYDPKTTDANTVLSGEGFTDQDGDSKVSFNDAVVQLKDDITVTTAGNYIAAGEDVAGNLAALDTQVKKNADDIAANAVIGTAATSSAGYAATDTVKDAVVAIDVAMKNAEDKNTVQDTGMGNLASTMGVTYTAATGAVSSTDYAYTNYVADGDSLVTAVGKLDNALKTADSNNAKLDADNIFTGHNTFNNANGITIQDGSAGNSTNITATANGLTVDRNVEAAGFKIAGSAPVVTSIDVDGSGVTSAATAANIMATAATVYNGAEKGAYTGTKVKGDTTSTTIKDALSATAAALNTLTTAAGNEIDSAKVDVQWNGTDSNLATVLGNGTYTSTNNIAAGDSVTAAISSLDSIVGDVANVTNTNGNLVGTDVASILDSIDVNMGDLTALTTSDKSSLVAAINEANGASAVIDAGIIGAGTAGTIQGQTLGNGSGGTITVRTALANLNATNVSQNGSLNSLAGLINGGTVDASTGAYTAGTDTLSTNFTAGNLTAAANELLTDITVAAGTYNAITAGAGAGANLQALDAAFTNGTIDAVFKDTTVDSLVIGGSNAITGAAGTVDMNKNSLTNVQGLTLTDASGNTGTLSADASGISTNTNFDVNGTLTVGSANQFVVDNSGNVTTSGDVSAKDGTFSGDLSVTGDASVGGDLGVTGTANVGALEIGTTGFGITGTGDATLNSLNVAGKGFDSSGNATTGTLTIGGANAITGTAASLDMNGNDLTNIKDLTTTGDATIGNDLTVTNDLTVGGDTSLQDTTVTGDFVISDGTNDVTMNVQSLTATMYDSTVQTDEHLVVDDNVFVDGMISSTHGFGVFDNTMQEVFDIDDTGSISSDMLLTDNTANTAQIGKDANSVVDAEGQFMLNKVSAGATEYVDTIDDGTTAATSAGANNAHTMATLASVLKSAENADYTTVGPNITAATTIGGAINTLDVEIGADADYTTTINGVAGTNTVKTNINNVNLALGDVSTVDVNGYTPATKNLTDAVSKLNDNMEAVLGAIYKADGTYDATQLAADGFVTGQTDLTASLTNYAANVETATGGTFDAAGVWSATVDNSLGSNSYAYVSKANLMDEINAVASNVGTAGDLAVVAPSTAAGDNNGIAATNTVNKNIAKLNAALGDISTLNVANGNMLTGGTGGTAPTTAVEAMNNIDATLGQIHALQSASTLGANSNLHADGATVSVEDHFVSLDDAIGDRTAIGSLNAGINAGTVTSVAAGLKAAGDAIGDMNFGTTHYVAGTTNLSESVRVLDNNLYRVESDLRDLKKEFKDGMASLSAMSALVPNPRASGDTSLSIGTGAYDGHTAVAFGGFHHITDNLMINAGAAWGNSNDVSYRMGVTWSW